MLKGNNSSLKLIKSHLRGVTYKMMPTSYLKLIYYKVFKEKLDLKKPTGFNEKLLWIMLNWEHPLMVKGADKYKMREYVESCGLKNILPKIYGVYSSSDQINWEELPNKFVLKCNHGSKYNIICNNKENFNKKEASRKLDKWLKEDYGYISHQRHYSRISPRIMCEEFLELSSGGVAKEYNVYCFNGKPEVILVYVEGTPHTENKSEFYDIHWNPLNIGAEENMLEAVKPSYLDELIEYSQKLAAPFPFVRVDFYALENEPILGELTFTSGAGLSKTYSAEGNEFLGSLLDLPEKYKNNYN